MTFAFPFKLTMATVVGSAAAALLLIAGPAAPMAQARGGCANSDATQGQASTGQLEKSVVCLINKERQRRGLNQVKLNSDLDGTQSGHVKTMLNQDCFSHQCNGEKSAKGRVKSSGYAGRQPFAFGEAIGYERTPQKMVNAWLDSSPHRAILLDEDAKDIGAAAGNGAPVSGRDDSFFETFSVVLATKG